MRTVAAGALAGVLGFAILGEALCRLLPVSTATRGDYYLDPHILTPPPHHGWRQSTGWDLRNPQRLSTNAHGFVSTREFIPDPRAVGLVGDSYVEAAALDSDDRPDAQLERTLKRPVYAMGSPGTSLLDYAERIRWAHEQLGIRDFVVMMERSDAQQSLCGSGNVHSQCLDPITFTPRTQRLPPPTPLKVVLRESALAQYFAGQLKIVPERLVRQVFTRAVPQLPDATAPGAAPATATKTQPTPEIDAVTHAFFERVRPHVTGRLVIVVDANRQALRESRPADDPRRRRFIELARAAGATVIDTEPLFKSHFDRSKLSLDVGPYDGHHNRLGITLIVPPIAKALGE